MVALLVQNMERLDEQVKEEADGIHNTLGKQHTKYRVFAPIGFLGRKINKYIILGGVLKAMR